MNSYELSRAWFNWSFENPEKIKPLHTALFFYIIECCNRLGWKEKFGFPSQMAMDALGVKNWRTYSKALNELEEFGFIKIIETSKNQYTANIIAIVNNTKAPTEASTKALDKALLQQLPKQLPKQVSSNYQSTVSIDKPETIKPRNQERERALDFLQNEYPQRFETEFSMRYKKKIRGYEKFVEDFNDTVDQDDLEYTAKKLFARLGKFARNWIELQDKFQPKHDEKFNSTSNIPIG